MSSWLGQDRPRWWRKVRTLVRQHALSSCWPGEEKLLAARLSGVEVSLSCAIECLPLSQMNHRITGETVHCCPKATVPLIHVSPAAYPCSPLPAPGCKPRQYPPLPPSPPYTHTQTPPSPFLPTNSLLLCLFVSLTLSISTYTTLVRPFQSHDAGSVRRPSLPWWIISCSATLANPAVTFALMPSL